MKAGDVMSTGAATVQAGASLADAARLMTQHGISGLPVVDDGGTLVGMVTEHDFLRSKGKDRPRWFDVLLGGSGNTLSARELNEVRVADVMSKPAISVDVGADVSEIVAIMQRDGVKRLPVLSGGKLVGIVSRANLLQVLVRRADGPPPRP